MTRRRRHSLVYLVYLRSPLWRIRRRIWIVCAGGRCLRCGSRRRLTIHHRAYRRLGHERRDDVTVLCWDCHRRHHAEHRRSSPHAGIPARTRVRARLRPADALRNGHGLTRLFALLALIAVPTLVLAATLVVQR